MAEILPAYDQSVCITILYPGGSPLWGIRPTITSPPALPPHPKAIGTPALAKHPPPTQAMAIQPWPGSISVMGSLFITFISLSEILLRMLNTPGNLRSTFSTKRL